MIVKMIEAAEDAYRQLLCVNGGIIRLLLIFLERNLDILILLIVIRIESRDGKYE